MKRTRIVRNVSLGVENLLLHKLRSFLTMLGVVFGVGSVVAMLSVGEGASQEALEQIRKLGSNNILISSIKPTEENANSTNPSFMSIYGLTYADQNRIDTGFRDIRRSVPVKAMRKDSRLGGRSLELRVVGTTSAWFDVVPRQVVAGRVLLSRDQTHRSPVAVLTEFGARKLLATEGTIGQSFRIGGDTFEIVGIVRSESGQAGSIQVPDQEVDVYIPIEVAQSYFGDVFTKRSSGTFIRERVELHQIIVEVDRTEAVEAVASGIGTMLKRFHKKADYIISIPLALLQEAEATKRRFNIVLGSIAGISLLVGGIGIMNIMLASVTERTREIGIRRAIGAKKMQILVQFLIETVVLSTVGGLIGLGIGVLIPFLITYFSGMPTVITLSGILLPISISLTIGLIFGIYPATRAAGVDPIVALRHE
jgi:putative ABC transport system permease protein